MPQRKANSYDIQAPIGTTVPPALRQRISAALGKIGASPKNWRYVVLPQENWQQIKRAWPNADDDFTNGVTVRDAHATYLSQPAIERMRDFELERLLAHEECHRYLNTANEREAQQFANNAMGEIGKYGRSNLAAFRAGKQLARQAVGVMRPRAVHVPMMLRRSR